MKFVLLLPALLGLGAASLMDNTLDGVGDDSAVVSEYVRLFSSVEFPSSSSSDLKGLRAKGRPFTVNVEGIVGTGKSTLLEFFKPYTKIDVIPEPVDKWTNLNGTDLLQLIFDDPKRWALAQESYVQLTMLEGHLRRVGVAKVMERSIHSGRFIFVENLARTGQMQKVEYDILDHWYDFLSDQVPGFDLQCDLTVYLQSDPKTVMKRIRKRGRREEAHITMEFLEGLHTLHEDWLVHKNTTFRMPSEKILVINTSHPLETMKKIYRKLAKKIWSIIPNELKGGARGGGNQQCYY